jgi:hypothetical protein
MRWEEFKSRLVIYIHGDKILTYEHYSHGFMEKLIELAEKEYGLVLVEKCRSRCG